MRKPHLLISFILFALLLLLPSCITRQYLATENYTETDYRTEYRTETYEEVEVSTNPVCDEERLQSSTLWYDTHAFSNTDYGSIFYFDYEIQPQAHNKVDIKIIFPRQLEKEMRSVSIYDLTATGHIEAPPSLGIIQGGAEYTYQQLIKLTQWTDSFNNRLAKSKSLGSLPYQAASDSNQEFECAIQGAQLVAVIITGPKYFWNTEIAARLVYCDNNEQKKNVTRERQVPYKVAVEVVKQRQVPKIETVPFWELIFK